jgi:peroxiredoxin Q/BCP
MSFDTPEENKAFAESFNFQFPLLSDVDGKVGEAYMTKRPPEHEWTAFPRRLSYLIDPEGKIVKAYRVKEVAAHPDEVLEDLKALQS